MQQRFGFFDREDRRLFCLAGREFYRSLDRDNGDRQRLLATFEEAAAEQAGEDGGLAVAALSTAPYQELVRCCKASL